MAEGKTIFEIQEKYVMEDWQDPQVNLIMLKECWQKAQKELIRDYIENPESIPIKIKYAVMSLEEE